MKKQLLFLLFISLGLEGSAQVISDSVSMGKEYANQVWYSLPNDEQGIQAKNNWDIAFRTAPGKRPTIMANHSGGSIVSSTLWVYPKNATAGWTSVDTVGLSTWTAQYNAETEWTGALGRYADAANMYDYGWGILDVGSHYIVGDSIYIIKTQTGSFKKLIIDKLGGSVYTFTYANLDGSDQTTSSLPIISYETKNFGYFNLNTKAAVDREPPTNSWDFVFGQFTTEDFVSTGANGYLVTGILSNDGVRVAKAAVLPSARATFKNYSSAPFENRINKIGYTWKGINLSGTINDSNVYFVQRKNGEIWKLVFTGWTNGLSGEGRTIFNKEKLSAASLKEQFKNNISLVVYPNPLQYGQQTQVVYSVEKNQQLLALTIMDVSGRVIIFETLDGLKGLHAYTLAGSNLTAGTYFIKISSEEGQVLEKIIVQ